MLYTEEKLLRVLLGELGVSEKSNPARVVEYLQATKLPPKRHVPSTPWCAAALSWALQVAGLRSPHTALARGFLSYGVPLDRPHLGSLVIYSRGNTGGHVGLYMSENGGRIWTLGGNQDDSVCVAPYDMGRVLGFRGVS